MLLKGVDETVLVEAARNTPAPIWWDHEIRRFRAFSRFPVEVCGVTVWIPEGEISDLSSIPWFFRWLISPEAFGVLAPFWHDKVHERGGCLPESWFEDPAEFRTWTLMEAQDAFADIARRRNAREWQIRLAHRGLKSYWWSRQKMGLVNWHGGRKHRCAM